MKYVGIHEEDIPLVQKALSELANLRLSSSMPCMRESGRKAHALEGTIIPAPVVSREALEKTLAALIEANKLSILYEGHGGMFAGHIKDAQAALDAAQT